MKIKMLVMDVDGTLTDGCIYMGAEGEMMKAFHVQDGYAIAQMLPGLGITPVIITGRSSKILEKRAGELKITHLHQGIGDKLTKLKAVAAQLGAAPEEIAFRFGWITTEELLESAKLYGKSPYGRHLHQVAEDKFKSFKKR